MAAPAANASAFTTLPSSSSPSSTNQKQLFKSTLPFPSYPNNPSNSQRRSLRITASLTNSTQNITPTSSTEHFTSRFPLDQPRKGADILVEALERQGVTDVFAYPGGASMEIHQALTRSTTIRNVLPRHEQGGIFAAEGYARSSGRPGICIATSGPGATNFVSGLVDAMLDSVPLIAITGHVPRRMIGTDAFQETPIVEVAASPRFTSAFPRFTLELGDRSPSQHREVLFIFEFHSEHWRPQ